MIDCIRLLIWTRGRIFHREYLRDCCLALSGLITFTEFNVLIFNQDIIKYCYTNCCFDVFDRVNEPLCRILHNARRYHAGMKRHRHEMNIFKES